MIKINHKELGSLLSKKNELVTEGREISKQIEKLETERNKVGLQIQKVKDKLIPLVKKLTEGKLEQFEEITTVEPYGSEIVINTCNVVEDFKRQYLEQTKGQEENK